MYQQWTMHILKIGWQSVYQKQDIAERNERRYKEIFFFHVQYCYSGNSPQIDL